MPGKSVVLARCCRKRPPILRNGRESVQLTYGLRAHGLAPVLAVSLFRRLSKFAIAARTASGAVPPGTIFVAMAFSTEGPSRKSFLKIGENFSTPASETTVPG